MASGVDYVGHNARQSNASTSQALLASLSAMGQTSFSSMAASTFQRLSSIASPLQSLHMPMAESSASISKAASLGKKTRKAPASRKTISCEVCSKLFQSVRPDKMLRYHEATTGHLQSRTIQRGVTRDDLKEMLRKRKENNVAYKLRQTKRLSSDSVKPLEPSLRSQTPCDKLQDNPSSAAAPKHSASDTNVVSKQNTTSGTQDSSQVPLAQRATSRGRGMYEFAHCNYCSRAFYGTNASAMVQRHMDSDRDCTMRPATKPEGAPDLRSTERQSIPTTQARDRVTPLPSSQILSSDKQNPQPEQRCGRSGHITASVDVFASKAVGLDRPEVSVTSTSITNKLPSQSAECTRCGRIFSGSRAKAHLSRHRNKLRHCNRYKDQMSLSIPSPAHTRPTKVTSTRPVQRLRKRSTGSLHSSDGTSDGSEGVWVTAIPADARPRTPDTIFTSHGKGKGRASIASNPDATLFPPDVLKKNDRREKKNKRKRMHDWVSSFSATTEEDASQSTSNQEQSISASLDLQSVSESRDKVPEPVMQRSANRSDRLDRSTKKRRKQDEYPARPDIIELNGEAPTPLACSLQASRSKSVLRESTHDPEQASYLATGSGTGETYWKADDFDDIATVCFKHQARYATPWPENMLEEHSVMLPCGEAALPAIDTPGEQNSEVQLSQRSWISSVRESVWKTLKSTGSRLSPRKTAT